MAKSSQIETRKRHGGNDEHVTKETLSRPPIVPKNAGARGELEVLPIHAITKHDEILSKLGSRCGFIYYENSDDVVDIRGRIPV